MADILRENNSAMVWYGSLDYIHECARRSGMYNGEFSEHPLNIIQKVLAGLDRSELFKKGYIKHIGRPARCYRLIKKTNSCEKT